MSRVLVIGYIPPHLEGDNRILAANYRTWQLIQPLLEEGHKIHLCCANYFSNNDVKYPYNEVREGNLISYKMNFLKEEQTEIIQSIHDEVNPDCIIAVTEHPSVIASKLRTRKPRWFDIYGHLMAEAQAKAHIYNDDCYLSSYWDFHQFALKEGDVFSVCGTPQYYGLIGELGAVGRLNKFTFGYEFAYPILPGAEGKVYIHDKNVIREKHVGRDDFVVLWCGGYNTWTDVETLFVAIEGAMKDNDAIKFVSVGGQIEGHDDLTYQKFQDMIAQSKYSDRFVMIGWKPVSEVHNYYLESDVGINIDKFHYETLLGTRTRLLEMLESGLPIITSLGCELSHIIKDNDIGLTFDIGDAQSLKECILRISRNPEEKRRYSSRGKEYAKKFLTFRATVRPLVEWVRNPKEAPDKKDRKYIEPVSMPEKVATESSKIDYVSSYGYIKATRICLRDRGVKYTIISVLKRFV